MLFTFVQQDTHFSDVTPTEAHMYIVNCYMTISGIRIE